MPTLSTPFAIRRRLEWFIRYFSGSFDSLSCTVDAMDDSQYSCFFDEVTRSCSELQDPFFSSASASSRRYQPGPSLNPFVLFLELA